MLRYFLLLFIFVFKISIAQVIEFKNTKTLEIEKESLLDIDNFNNVYYLQNTNTLCKKKRNDFKVKCFKNHSNYEIANVQVYNSLNVMIRYFMDDTILILDKEFQIKQRISNLELENDNIAKLNHSQELIILNLEELKVLNLDLKQANNKAKLLFYLEDITEDIIDFEIRKDYFIFKSNTKYWLYSKYGVFMQEHNIQSYKAFGFYKNYLITLEENNRLNLVNLKTFINDFSLEIKQDVNSIIFKNRKIFIRENNKIHQYQIKL